MFVFQICILLTHLTHICSNLVEWSRFDDGGVAHEVEGAGQVQAELGAGRHRPVDDWGACQRSIA